MRVFFLIFILISGSLNAQPTHPPLWTLEKPIVWRVSLCLVTHLSFAMDNLDRIRQGDMSACDDLELNLRAIQNITGCYDP